MANNAVEPSRFDKYTKPIDTLFSAMQLDMLRLRQLRAKGGQVTRTIKEMAAELDTTLQGMAVKVEQSELATQVTHAYQLHRFLSGIKNRFLDKLKEERRFCKVVLDQWTDEEAARVAARKRALEAQQQRDQENQRLEEAAHLESIGDTAGAEQVLNEPVIVSVAVEPEKIEGISSRKYWTVTGFTDVVAFVRFLADNPHHLAGVNLDLRKSYWKQVLNRAAGTPSIPGLEVVREAVVTNRNNSNADETKVVDITGEEG